MDRPATPLVAELAPDYARWDELLALILRAFAYMDEVIDPPSSAHRLTPENLESKARQETVFLAVENGRLAGCVFALERANDFYVGKLAVEPGLQGRGIGARLMQAVEDLARRRGKPAIELQTRIELAANHAAFARLGFRETGRTAHAGYDRPTSITMRKVLS
ncbi:GNAT family N-acetyltransferase [Mesorhizobium sp. M1C.F.Ca.ET.193.01.1.1]|uniref:GNAT family N-acetyltransferase n=1 Tax=unclassified Mesorhizobium TaxID=325217 RepID=UPI000FD2620D|nr:MULTISPECIES: GNAT family N-acetyltransferase [unclassified Mesorhizobium]TGT04131.1 GNAT family N-acetyltransferase [bacterium M00.F.Ca.ET.177.01.1.1]RWA77388.1 MAG: GNAT family N-acetyltransferase [Mesorhizobium sp.]RWC05662.1 MAG: GNAT family N-acetyltransferase [Mesorhizobium sp.]RWG87699.1 MAG: GNAT family N-acetyltransferase [Mesorhizobium sp.]RWG91681.1 MAG: GNAT family N-acetyltransferase [Mesorhizobium sp.]